MSVNTKIAAATRRWTFGGLFGKGLLTVYVGLMLIWLLFPIVLVLLASFQGKLEVSLSLGDVSLEAYKAIPPAYWEAFWFTVRIAFTATTNKNSTPAEGMSASRALTMASRLRRSQRGFTSGNRIVSRTPSPVSAMSSRSTPIP